jgi:hypothetical protein
LRVTPACTASEIARNTERICSSATVDGDAAMRRVDLAFGEVPVPNGSAARDAPRTAARLCTSSVLVANTTASGGCGRCQVKLLACWVHTACDVETRFGQRAWRASTTRPTDETGVASLTGLLSFMSLVSARARFLPEPEPRRRGGHALDAAGVDANSLNIKTFRGVDGLGPYRVILRSRGEASFCINSQLANFIAVARKQYPL